MESQGLHKDTMDELDRPERVKYLEAIDRIRETGVTGDISLPQLVVVGDQSSGKSSLLEGITGLSFPISSDVCTRFATQIILRRRPAEQAGAVIDIIPGPSSASDAKAKANIEKFRRTIKKEKFDGNALSTILSEASEYLGLPAIGAKLDEKNIPSKRFTDSIVRIELCGPEQHHLSVVDVPGLFHNPTQFQTSEDKVIIRNLIKRYVDDKRTIVLAVCNALANLAAQEVFQIAREADPDGQRTVGIVTKCDTVASGDEESVMKIAENKYQPLKHGWFAVKNRSTDDINKNVSIPQRHENEKAFFENQKPWSRLGRDRRGVGPLKEYLGKLLSDHIRAEFPSMVRELQTRKQESVGELEQLGDSRQSANEQRRFLGDIATLCQKRVEDALSGTYDTVARGRPLLKLRKKLRDLDDEFASRMRVNGHTHVFRTVQDQEDEEYARPYNPFAVKTTEQHIYKWLKTIYMDNRGVELPGLVNPFMLRMTFQEQTVKWEGIAVDYFDKTVHAIESFNEELLALLAPDKDVRRSILAILQLRYEEPFNKARQSLRKYLSDERENVLKTANDYYSETLHKCREERTMARFKNIGVTTGATVNIDMTKMLSAANLKNEDQAVNDIHDALKAYYKVSLKRFVDNVINGVVETELLGESGPVKIFNPRFVNSLSDVELANIAEETSVTSTARAECSARIERLQQALNMARGMGV